MSSHEADAATQQWLLKRNCALSPRQLAVSLGMLACISVLIAGVFAWRGAWPVLLFSGFEVLGLVIAFVAYGRRAADYERIVVWPQRITVETMRSNRLSRHEMARDWLRIEYGRQENGLVRLVRGTESLQIGSLVAPGKREQLAVELRSTLAVLDQGRISA